VDHVLTIRGFVNNSNTIISNCGCACIFNVLDEIKSISTFKTLKKSDYSFENDKLLLFLHKSLIYQKVEFIEFVGQ